MYLFSISSSDIDSLRIVQEKKWNQIHKFKNGEVSSCTSLVTNSNDIVTIGEDGTINLLSAQHESVHKIGRWAYKFYKLKLLFHIYF